MRWVLAVRPVRPVLLVAGAVLALLLVLWAAVPGHVVPLVLVHGLVFALAVGPAFLMDEEALEITQVTVRGRDLRLRIAVPVGLVTCLVAWWAMATLLTRASPGAPLGPLTRELVGVALAAWAAAALLSRRGVACPGSGVAAVTMLAALTELFIGPVHALADAMPPGAPASWWPGFVLSAAAVGLLSCRDVAARRLTLAFRSDPAPGDSPREGVTR